jgi:Leucine-rich repeat (LRR) protein
VVLVDEGMEAFPTEIFSGILTIPLAQIRLLDLSTNRLPSIPPHISEMRHLTCLRLSDNCLDSIPLELAQVRHHPPPTG